MNPTEIIFAARDLGVRLSATKEYRISYKPKGKMPEWLLEQIRESKEALLRDLLLQDALGYLAEHYAPGADLEVLDPFEDQLNAAHADGTLRELREAVRAYVRAGLAEFQRTRSAA